MTQKMTNPWWQISVNNETAEILLYDEIDEFFGTDAKGFIEDLNALGDDIDTINLRINSPGGSVFQGIAIFNALKRHRATVNVYIDGIAFSMASGIAMAGDTVNMCENGIMMLHNPQAVVAGDESEMTRTATMLSKVKSALIKAYSAKSGQSDDDISALMEKETFMTAEEAFEMGFVDAINECKQMAASFDTSSLNVPSRLRRTFNSLIEEPEEMAQSKDAGASAKATLQELKALNDNSDFIVACLEQDATIEQARDSLINNQKEKIAELQDIVTDLQLKVDNGVKEDTLRRQGSSKIPDPMEAQKKPAAAAQPAAQQPAAQPQPAPPEQTKTDIGNTAVPIGSQTTHAPNDEWDGDAFAFCKKAHREIKAELQAAGKPFTINDILRLVHNKYPKLEEAMRQQAENA